MSDLKMFCIEASTQPPIVSMVYDVSKPNAERLWRETYLSCNEASALQIAAHVRAGLPILGEPTPPDPAQTKLEGV